MLICYRNIFSVLIHLYVILFFPTAAENISYVTIYDPLPGEFPFLISLISKIEEQFYCTSVLITPWHSVTSCRCLTSPLTASRQRRLEWDQYLLVAGITTIYRVKKRGQTRQLEFLVVHPGCEKVGNFIKYDLGIAISQDPFKLGKFVDTAKLPYRVETIRPFRFKRMFKNDLIQSNSVIAASLAFWSNGGKETHGKLKIVRMAVIEAQETKYSRFHKENIYKDSIQYTRVIFDTSFCPSFNEAAIFSDEQVFFGIVTDIKDRLCNHKDILFTRIDYVMEWIVHVISKGIVEELNTFLKFLIFLLLYLKL